METEIWKDVPGYEGLYQASNLGRIKTLNYRKSGKEQIKKSTIGKNGYVQISMSKYGKMKFSLLHRLIAITFLENPENKPHINHKNGIKHDNRLENLEWNTRSENTQHAYNNGLMKNNIFTSNNPIKGKLGILNHNSKKVDQYTKSGEFIKTWNCMSDIQRELGIKVTNISFTCRGKGKTSGGFKWVFNI